MQHERGLLQELWISMIKFGERTREGNMNGLERWNLVKELIPNVKILWIKSAKKIYDDLIKLGVNNSEEWEESGLSHTDWERQHYLLQHGRIIYKNPDGSVVRLLQIAYNIGQFKVEVRRKPYTEEQMKYYRDNKLDDIWSYIDGFENYDIV
jgi:hypothetical protein